MLHILHRLRIECRTHGFVAFCLAVLFLTLTGCGPQSPEAKVTAARAKYTVSLERLTAKHPDPPEIMEPEGEAVAEAAEAAMATTAVAAEAAEAEEAEEGEADEEGEEGMDEMGESGPRPTDVILHLLVRFTGDDPLPGITVEVTQADPFGKEKEPTLQWIETADMTKNDLKQVDLKLEGVEFEDGDAFSVLLRQVVPAAERGGYREYAEAAP